MAQVTTRYISELPSLGLEKEAKRPVVSAMEAMRKPISPRAVMAVPSIAAGYRERGFLGLGGALEVTEVGAEPWSVSVVFSPVGGRGAASLPSRGCNS